jgi:hypothetical protein
LVAQPGWVAAREGAAAMAAIAEDLKSMVLIANVLSIAEKVRYCLLDKNL